MINFFKKKKPEEIFKEKSIYERIIEAEENSNLSKLNIVSEDFNEDSRGNYEIKILDGEKTSRIDTAKLNEALLKFYKRDHSSVELICEYFKDKRAIEAFPEFESFIFSLEVFEEKKLAGLSILLMRDVTTVEAVKFGILLSYFYPLVNYPAAVKIITDLGIYPEFTYYSLSVLKQLNYYEVVKGNILRRGLEEVREIERKMK